MNTIVGKKMPDLAHVGLIVLIPVTFYWVFFFLCHIMNETGTERFIMFHSIIPRKLIGLHVSVLVFLLTGISMFCSVTEKIRRRTRWYKTASHIRFAIWFGMFIMFLNFLRMLY
ncbi:MAG: hypothetical protein DWQ44_07355 [Bacteroidetes bacterium]|nr:MAG: hypothetical protein DWQ33_12330 [Bacteroidota bacterium]REJ99831.1 MAG: hypothetical protein DWQ39_12975 [Bacteroidota bacterium]REK34204.1 MAG: hypothetical protein DWQ44_07355 [Bacteroidota bacterium]REK50534.1 MAG: hypothetical protein DWQ48_04265 [Bacteroidota bacterium]